MSCKKFCFALTLLLLLLAPLVQAAPSPWAQESVREARALEFVPNSLEQYQKNITRCEFAVIATCFLARQYNFMDSLCIEPAKQDIPIFNTQVSYNLGSYAHDFLNVYCKHHTDPAGKPYKKADYTQLASWQGDDNTWRELVENPESPYQPFSDIGDSMWKVPIRSAKLLGLVQGDPDGKFRPEASISRQEAAVMLARVYARYDGIWPDTIPDIHFRDQDKIAPWARDAVALMSAMGIMQGVGNAYFDPAGAYTLEQSIATFQRLYQNAPTSLLKQNVKPLRSWTETRKELNLFPPNYSAALEYQGADFLILAGNMDVVAAHTVYREHVFVLLPGGGYYVIKIPIYYVDRYDFDPRTNILCAVGDGGHKADLQIETRELRFTPSNTGQ